MMIPHAAVMLPRASTCACCRAPHVALTFPTVATTPGGGAEFFVSRCSQAASSVSTLLSGCRFDRSMWR